MFTVWDRIQKKNNLGMRSIIGNIHRKSLSFSNQNLALFPFRVQQEFLLLQKDRLPLLTCYNKSSVRQKTFRYSPTTLYEHLLTDIFHLIDILNNPLGYIGQYLPITFFSSCCHEPRILKSILLSPGLIELEVVLFYVIAEGSSLRHWKSQLNFS